MKENIKTVNDLGAFFNKIRVFEQFALNRIGVFGSFARGEKFNDIDILIESSDKMSKFVNLKNILESQSGIRFDVVVDRYADPIILNRAKKDIVYVKEHQE